MLVRSLLSLWGAVLLLWPFIAFGQGVPCSVQYSPTEKAIEYTTCLERAIADLQTMLELYRDRQAKFDEQLHEQVRKEVLLEVYGPAKSVVRFPAKMLRTISFWSGGNNHGVRQCKDTALVPPPNSTQVGGKGEIEYHQYKISQPGATLDIIYEKKKIGTIPTPPDYAQKSRACRIADDCDSTGEHCVSYERPAGCFVNTDWMEWYTRRAKAMQVKITDEDYCADPTTK